MAVCTTGFQSKRESFFSDTEETINNRREVERFLK